MRSWTRPFTVALALSWLAVGCDSPTVPSPPQGPSASSTAPLSPNLVVHAAYAATLAASPSCSGELPAAARTRQYVATLYESGRLAWNSSSLYQPTGHAQVSSARQEGDSFSLTIGTTEDPQSDAFHGIGEALGGRSFMSIAGTGTGRVLGTEIVGVFDGIFRYYEVTASGEMVGVVYCSAADHSFRLQRTTTLSFTVSGVVLDGASAALSGATVEWAGLAEAWGDRGHGVLTDAAGGYRLRVGNLGGPGSADARIVMRASKPGYTANTQQVQLRPEAETTVNFRLER